MHRCPTKTCGHRLHRNQSGRDVYWSCGICHGRALSINTIAHRNYDLAVEIAHDTQTAELSKQKLCPFCGRGMAVTFLAENAQLELDYCAPCQAVWFDPGETDGMAVQEVQQHLKAPDVSRIRIQMPDRGWQYVTTLIGLPAESHARPMDGQPILTWLLTLATICFSVAAFQQPMLRAFAFLPIEPFRLGGITLLSSFFLHGGWFHLLSNMYFLMVFGDDSEDYLGKVKYLGLLILATVGGNLCVILLKEAPHTIHIGASGGIFGVLTFYLLNFPRSRITFFKFFVWVRVSPFLALAYMLGIQLIGAWLSSHGGFTAVSYGSHLGGAAVGGIFWVLFGERRFSKAKPEDKFKTYK